MNLNKIILFIVTALLSADCSEMYHEYNDQCYFNDDIEYSISENVPTPDNIIFKLCTASQLPYNAKFKKIRKLIKFDFLYIFSVYVSPIFH